ncbi:hypothetical protein NEF87_003166 [Candidatus Lokiarchaeum ossiferum]|uniref:histidine kinase n=1 Tax=Candidatus Lokiarchaeum ossiferum TaxID=2951803 RepID=A0ABY6HTY8_9ARCH|nr:hypothetical protein NEF87_003166 [Candidatus Lokiarchaeum sp. B-35]
MQIKKGFFTLEMIFLGLLGVILFVVMEFNYLLFHSFIEIFAIVIFFTTFLITVISRKIVESSLLLLIGISSISYAFLDLLHLLTYQGMGVFIAIDTNIPTQFWIAARYFQSISFLIGLLFSRKHVNSVLVLAINMVLVTFILLSIFTFSIFPDCYVEGDGLTLFKIISEYIISGFYGLSIYLLFRKRKKIDSHIYIFFQTALVLNIISELLFSFYTDVYGLTNFFGHVLKFFACYCFMKSIIMTFLKNPVNLLVFSLKKHERELKQELLSKDILIKDIHHRVKNNLQMISSLIILQSHEIQDEETLTVFQELQDRIQSFSLLHRHIYQSPDLSQISLESYLTQLVQYLKESINVKKEILMEIEIADVMVSTKIAINCALIITELYSNAMKHAFNHQESGKISICISQLESNHLELTFKDNGMTKIALDSLYNSKNLGFQLVLAGVEQLRGKLALVVNDGLQVIIKFPLDGKNSKNLSNHVDF